MKERRFGGEWWVPAEPSRRVAGTLEFDPSKAASLDLMGILIANSEFRGGVVLGDTSEAVPATVELLWEADRSIRSSRLVPTSVETQVLAAETVFVGASLPQPEDRKFDHCEFTFSDLPEWSAMASVGVDLGEDKRSVELHYTPRPTLHAFVEGVGNIELSYSWSTVSANPERYCLDKTVAFVVNSDRPRDLKAWLDEIIGPLRDLMTLATCRANQIGDVVFFLDEGEDEPRTRVEALFAPPSADLPARRTTRFRYAFSAVEIEARFEDVLRGWFALESEIGPAIDNYLSAEYRPSMFITNRFLNVVGAVEAYHRRRYPNEVIPGAEHAARVASILSGAPVEHREWLTSVLDYTNEPSLRRRIKDLRRRVDAAVEPPVVENAAELAQEVIEVRNRLIHSDPARGEEGPAGEELYWMSEKLSLVLSACLLQELAFDDETLKKNLPRTERWMGLSEQGRDEGVMCRLRGDSRDSG